MVLMQLVSPVKPDATIHIDLCSWKVCRLRGHAEEDWCTKYRQESHSQSANYTCTELVNLSKLQLTDQLVF